MMIMPMLSPKDQIVDLLTLPKFLQFQAIAMAQFDFLNRKSFPSIPSDFDSSIVRVLMDSSGGITGTLHIIVDTWVTYRSFADMGENHQSEGSLIELPITLDFNSSVWETLILDGLSQVYEMEKKCAIVAIPVDCNQIAALCQTIGFYRLGIISDPKMLSALGYATEAVVFAYDFKSQNANSLALYPFAEHSKVRLRATGSDAPQPDNRFWKKAYLYSGYSSYPFQSRLLRFVLDKGQGRLLSAPSATGDVPRYLHAGHKWDEVVCLDINPDFISFSRDRLEKPEIDVVNRGLNRLFLDCILTRDKKEEDIFELLTALGQLLRLNFDTKTVRSIFRQLRTAFVTCVQNCVIADYFILLKGIGRLADSNSHNTHPLAGVSKLFTIPGFTECIMQHLPDNYARNLESIKNSGEYNRKMMAEGRIKFHCVNVLEDTSVDSEKFDCIYNYESLLMFFGAGLHEQFVNAMLSRLKGGGCIIITGIRNNTGEIPHELRWAHSYLEDRGLKACSLAFRMEPTSLEHANMREQVTPLVYATK